MLANIMIQGLELHFTSQIQNSIIFSDMAKCYFKRQFLSIKILLAYFIFITETKLRICGRPSDNFS